MTFESSILYVFGSVWLKSGDSVKLVFFKIRSLPYPGCGFFISVWLVLNYSGFSTKMVKSLEISLVSFKVWNILVDYLSSD